MASDPADDDIAELGRKLIARTAEKHRAPDAPRPERAPPPRQREIPLDPDRLAEKRFASLVSWGIPDQTAMLIVNRRRTRTLEETMALRYVDEFLARADDGLYNICVLAGVPGTGKTVAAAHFLERASPRRPFGGTWKADERPRFLHSSEFLVMGLYDHEEERDRLKRTMALVVDDQGVERLDAGGVGLALFDWLINARYGAAGYTLITTNLPWEQFRERYGERIADRLKEQADWYDLEGESMRKAPL